MPQPDPSIDQILRNYTTNLPAFPPSGAGPAALHRFFTRFYQGFQPSARALGIPEKEQPKLLERAQKTLWAFGRLGHLNAVSQEPVLVLERPALQESLKFPRPEQTLALLERLGVPVGLRVRGVRAPVAVRSHLAGGDTRGIEKLLSLQAEALRRR